MSAKGTVVTFYSYKGGVGRSFALANVGIVIGKVGVSGIVHRLGYGSTWVIPLF